MEKEGNSPGCIEDIRPFGLVKIEPLQFELFLRRAADESFHLFDELFGRIGLLPVEEIAGKKVLFAEIASEKGALHS
jgi:hypothetical protein